MHLSSPTHVYLNILIFPRCITPTCNSIDLIYSNSNTLACTCNKQKQFFYKSYRKTFSRNVKNLPSFNQQGKSTGNSRRNVKVKVNKYRVNVSGYSENFTLLIFFSTKCIFLIYSSIIFLSAFIHKTAISEPSVSCFLFVS